VGGWGLVRVVVGAGCVGRGFGGGGVGGGGRGGGGGGRRRRIWNGWL